MKQRLKRGNRLESLHDIQQIKEESQQTFDLGLLDLESKAKIDTVYWQLAQQIVNMHRGLRFVPDEVKQLETSLGDQYICNFSVFQSLLDHWALGQLFPIMPIHRLTTPPDRNGMIVDITCDSDGKVSKFTDLQDVRDTLPLHRIIPGEIYYLGVFMVGAYQDIMGDLHNLFGRVTEVHVFLDPDEESRLVHRGSDRRQHDRRSACHDAVGQGRADAAAQDAGRRPRSKPISSSRTTR